MNEDVPYEIIVQTQERTRMTASRHRWLTAKDRWLAWTVAVVIHVLLGGALWLFSSRPDHLPSAPTGVPIKARLVFAAPVTSENDEAAMSSEQDKPATRPQMHGENAPALTPSPSIDITPSEPVTLSSSVKPDKPTHHQAKQVVKQQTSKKNGPPAPRISAAAALNKYLSQREQNKISQLGASDARAARQQRASPALTDKRKNQVVEDTFTPRKTRVRCDNTAATIATTLSTLTGGTLQCSPPANIAPHIDRRLRESGAKKSLQQ